MFINGQTFTETRFQNASDMLAQQDITAVTRDSIIPDAKTLIGWDIQGGSKYLGLQPWQWAGTMADILPTSMGGLGGDFQTLPTSSAGAFADSFVKANAESWWGVVSSWPAAPSSALSTLSQAVLDIVVPSAYGSDFTPPIISTNSDGYTTTQYLDGSASIKVLNPTNGSYTISTANPNGNTSVINYNTDSSISNVATRTVNTADGTYTTDTADVSGKCSSTTYNSSNDHVISTTTVDSQGAGSTTIHNPDTTITQTNFSATGPSISTTYDSNMHEISSTITRPDSSRTTENYDTNGNIIFTANTNDTPGIITAVKFKMHEMEAANDGVFKIRSA
jgi:hypothetical protein